MPDIWSKFDSGDLIMLVVVLGTILFSIVLVAAVHWHKVRESDNATKLKIEMINRGMSAEEIKAVLDAEPSKPPGLSVNWTKSGFSE
jgi:hypothetical protein